ncbi:putative secreted protein (Por secretion system target) [Larkinella arboricola]|uniref:Putative secreted protein (Por secretion system target) n=1 Tax=Larkinella arboricola TaxID=643671 RepID=A0A327WNI4_LARAB|nr:malectin domain-containing carbohydrate-binding protein [Larkinella arboricola]RAJ93261.1 putative secreted protein (Por secretion system target) [Larkinella arboricola]
MTGVSIQTDWNNVYAETRLWVERSSQAGKKWIVANDEQNDMGVATDADYAGRRGTLADNQDEIRKECLWGNLMAGGAGIEYYFGGYTGETDLAAEDYRSRAKMYRFTRHALDFFRNYVPLLEVAPMDNSDRGWVLGQEGQVYILYLKDGGAATINLGGGRYTVQWYDPRSGGALQYGAVRSLSGHGRQSTGLPPSATKEDWVVLIRLESNSVDQPVTNAYRINAGGSSYTTPDGRVFSADTYASGGAEYTINGSTDIQNTEDDGLYRNERYGDFSYRLPVSNGSYRVTLHFAEVYARSAGQRKFNVALEGERILTEYDIFARAGGGFRALQETFITQVRDGVLNLDFTRGSVGNAKISAIEVVQTDATAARWGAGLSAETLGVQLQAYPNPFTDFITLRLEGPAAQALPVVIYDSQGRVVLQLAEVKSEQRISLGNAFPPGLYVLKVGEGKGATSHTLLKVR